MTIEEKTRSSITQHEEEFLSIEGGRAAQGGKCAAQVECPSLETFKTQLDVFLCHLCQVTLPWQEPGLSHLQRFLPTLM